MPIITIRGNLGSGVHEIAEKTAHLLRCNYIDREIIENVARLINHPVDQVAEKEQIPTQLTQRIKAALEKALTRSGSMNSAFSRTWQESLDDRKYIDALKSVIEDIALEENIVIHGRGSQFILHNNPSALHVLVVAPLSLSIKRVMTEFQIDENKARKQIEEYNNSRRVFIRRFFKRDIEDPEFYDLVVNTENVTYDMAAKVIVKAAQRKSPWTKL